MKNRYRRPLLITSLLAFGLATGVASAGSTETMMAPPDPATKEDVISGVLKLDLNTHFISYGTDVWGDGNPNYDDLNFNPFLELSFKLPAGFRATLGTWWDVNNKGTGSTLGGNIREVDVWGGLAYSIDKFTAGVVYQVWNYGSATEEILDVNFSYDCFLHPTLTVHNRLGKGASGGDEGTVIVGGLSYGLEAGPATISFPVNIAFFATDDYHRADSAGGADTGFGYLSLGAGASLPLSTYMGSAYGDWTLNGGLTYYFTDNDVTVNNVENHFLTASLGLSLAF